MCVILQRISDHYSAFLNRNLICNWYKSLETTLLEGLSLTADYMDRVGTEEGYLIIFNRNPDTKWEEKIWIREEQYGEYRIGVWGM